MHRWLASGALLLATTPAWAANDAAVGTAAALLAPATAVIAALLTRRVVPSLASGVIVGALLATGLGVGATFHLLYNLSVGILLDFDNLTVTAFTLAVAATVGVVGRSGATKAVVQRVERIAKGRRGAMVASWLSGMLLFFDDYANCLVVGNTMAPLYDRMRVSREKLAYVVDSTAAPVASLAVVSTWVGYELTMIGKGLSAGGSELQPLALFVESIPYRFYSIFCLAFVGMVAFTRRDFGPMAEVEAAARTRPVPEELADGGSEVPAWCGWLAVVPIATLIGVTIASLAISGFAGVAAAAQEAGTTPTYGLIDVLGSANAYGAMLHGSVSALVVAIVLPVGLKVLSVVEAGQAVWTGARAVLGALAVLYLAWLLGDVIAETQVDVWLASALDGRLDPTLLPTATFGVAAAIAFATGTSFGTMGILLPLALPVALGMDGAGHEILLATTAAVLAGACFGDHSSPISDTTLLSSVGAGVDVVAHVRTQLPYAMTCALIAVVVGYLPAAMGLSVWFLLPVGLIACFLIIRVFGRLPPPDPAPPAGNLITPGQ